MSKLVVLKLDGQVDQGFQVTVEIGVDSERASVEFRGELPPSPKILGQLDNWRKTYRELEMATRLRPKEVTYRSCVEEKIVNCSYSAAQLQETLAEWLDSRDFSGINKQLREELNRDEQIQFLIRSNDEKLSLIPWHLWDFIKRYPYSEVTFSTSTFRRVSRAKHKKSNVRILAILGNSGGINVNEDRRALESLPNVELTFLVEPTPKDIDNELWEQSWDVLFFAGHSETKGEKGRIHINPYDSLTIEDLKYGLTKAISQGLQLAIFNSCDGLGLAHELEQLHIPQIIVMREPVPDSIAQEFLKYFLKAYSDGSPLHLAMRYARERLQALELCFPYATWLPVIFQNPAEVALSWKELSGHCKQSSISYSDKESKTHQVEEHDYYNRLDAYKKQELILSSAPAKPLVFGAELNTNNSSKVEAFDKHQIGVVVQSITASSAGRVRGLGSDWPASFYSKKCLASIHPGELVRIVGRQGIRLLVAPFDQPLQDENESKSGKSLFSKLKQKLGKLV